MAFARWNPQDEDMRRLAREDRWPYQRLGAVLTRVGQYTFLAQQHSQQPMTAEELRAPYREVRISELRAGDVFSDDEKPDWQGRRHWHKKVVALSAFKSPDTQAHIYAIVYPSGVVGIVGSLDRTVRLVPQGAALIPPPPAPRPKRTVSLQIQFLKTKGLTMKKAQTLDPATQAALSAEFAEWVKGRKLNPQDEEMRRLERAAAQGDAVTAQRLAFEWARRGLVRKGSVVVDARDGREYWLVEEPKVSGYGVGIRVAPVRPTAAESRVARAGSFPGTLDGGLAAFRLTGKMFGRSVKLGPHISHGFYQITEADAKRLAGKLPRSGYEVRVEHEGKLWWLARTPLGGRWVWSIREAGKSFGSDAPPRPNPRGKKANKVEIIWPKGAMGAVASLYGAVHVNVARAVVRDRFPGWDLDLRFPRTPFSGALETYTLVWSGSRPIVASDLEALEAALPVTVTGPPWPVLKTNPRRRNPFVTVVGSTLGNPPRFVATSQGMKRGYWRVVDTATGQTVRSGFSSKAVAQQVANSLNRSGPEGISGSRSNPMLAAEAWHGKGTPLLIQTDAQDRPEFIAQGFAAKRNPIATVSRRPKGGVFKAQTLHGRRGDVFRVDPNAGYQALEITPWERGLPQDPVRATHAYVRDERELSANPGPTLADAAEAWARSRGMSPPRRGTPAWRALYDVWQRHGMPRRNPLDPQERRAVYAEVARSISTGEAAGGRDTFDGAWWHGRARGLDDCVGFSSRARVPTRRLTRETIGRHETVGMSRNPGRFGVFVWVEKNRYPAAEAVRIFAREHDAQRFADKLNADPAHAARAPRGWVVRPVQESNVPGWLLAAGGLAAAAALLPRGAATRGRRPNPPLRLPRERYLGTITIAEARRRGIKGIDEAIQRYRHFHGGLEPPDALVGYDDGRQEAGFLIGRADEVNYSDAPAGSNKAGSKWVHKTSSQFPTYAVHVPYSETMALIGDMPSHGVQDWLRERGERRGR